MTESSFPYNFSPRLIQHCQQGGIPPVIFHDIEAARREARKHGAWNRLRFIRVNERQAGDIVDAGYRLLSSLDSTGESLSVGEQEVTRAPRVTPSTFTAPGATSRPLLLSLGLSHLTGLPRGAVQIVSWLPGPVFSLPWSYSMSKCPLYRDGAIIPMDATSMAAVAALRPRVGDRVLDLCCSPGMKLGLILDAVAPPIQQATAALDCSNASSRGLAVGVDINLDRLFSTRSVLRKQQQPHSHATQSTTHEGREAPVCLFRADGCSFSIKEAMQCLDQTTNSGRCSDGTATSSSTDGIFPVAPAAVDPSTGLTAKEKYRLRRSRQSPAEARKRCRSCVGAEALKIPPVSTSLANGDEEKPCAVVYATPVARAALASWAVESEHLFDRVLVDAECSHDGSLSHLKWASDSDDENRTGGDDNGCKTQQDLIGTDEVGSKTKKSSIDNAYRMEHLNIGAAAPSVVAPSLYQIDLQLLPEQCIPLFELQMRLLLRGYTFLKPGGTLVYSTCSFSFLQNELILHRFLQLASQVDQPWDTEKSCIATKAVVVPVFSFDHEAALFSSIDTAVAGCMRMQADQEVLLQQTLDRHASDYDVVKRGAALYLPAINDFQELFLGSRLWPSIFQSSFLYIAKVWKKPLV